MNKQKKTAGNHEMKDRTKDLQRNQNWKNTGKNLELKKNCEKSQYISVDVLISIIWQ